MGGTCSCVFLHAHTNSFSFLLPSIYNTYLFCHAFRFQNLFAIRLFWVLFARVCKNWRVNFLIMTQGVQAWMGSSLRRFIFLCRFTAFLIVLVYWILFLFIQLCCFFLLFNSVVSLFNIARWIDFLSDFPFATHVLDVAAFHFLFVLNLMRWPLFIWWGQLLL